MVHTQRKQNITHLAALVVFTIFAACVLVVLLSGADLYQRLTERNQHSYDSRTAAQYITTRIRQADCAGGVTIENFNEVKALALHEEIDGAAYITRVYCWEGYVRELFTDAGTELSPEAGEKLMEIEALSFQLTGPLLSVEISHRDGSTQTLTLFLRSGEEAAP